MLCTPAWAPPKKSPVPSEPCSCVWLATLLSLDHPAHCIPSPSTLLSAIWAGTCLGVPSSCFAVQSHCPSKSESLHLSLHSAAWLRVTCSEGLFLTTVLTGLLTIALSYFVLLSASGLPPPHNANSKKEETWLCSLHTSAVRTAPVHSGHTVCVDWIKVRWC